MTAPVTAGLMRQRITIQERADTVNALGEPVPAWADLHAGLWAQMKPLRGREFFAAGQMQTPVDVMFRIRYRAGITSQMRVMHNGQPYEIAGEPINVDGAGVTLELMCISGVRDGR